MKRALSIAIVLVLGGFVTAGGLAAYRHRSTARVHAALATARQLQATGDTSAAVQAFDTYLALAGKAADPDALVDHGLLALDLAAKPDASTPAVDRAIAIATTAIPRRPTDMRLRRRLAELQLSKGLFPEAREHLLVIREAIARGAVEEDPAEIDLRLARTWLGTGDHRQALTIVAKLTGFRLDSGTVAESEPGATAAAYLLLAEILRDRLADSEAANRVLERCAKTHPDDPAALVPYVAVLWSRKEPQQALEAASRAAALAPTDPTAVLTHAYALLAAGDVAAAIPALLDAVRRFPWDKELFAAAASHVAMQGTSDQTLTLLDAALERFAVDEATVLHFLATMTVDSTTWPDFARRLDEARERFGADNPAVVVLQARVLEARGHWAAAERPLLQARSLVSESAKANVDLMLAGCFAAVGDLDETVAACQRVEQDPFAWPHGMLGLADARLALGHAEAAAEIVTDMERRTATTKMTVIRLNLVLPALTKYIRVTAAQPDESRDWRRIDAILDELTTAAGSDSDPRLAMTRSELLAAKGDLDAALDALPTGDTVVSSPRLDALRLSLIARRDGIAAMRAARAAMPGPRRDRGQVLDAAARAEARNAKGDERGWLNALAAASDRIDDAAEAVQVLHLLAGFAKRAGWKDDARAIETKALQRLPTDFRAPLALALDAARTGDVAAAKSALAQLEGIEGKGSPRLRVAAAASLVAAVRGERADGRDGSQRLTDSQRRRLEEARALLRDAADVRKRWQAIAALSSDIESIAGNQDAAFANLEKAVACGPRDPGLIREFAAALDRNRRHADAESLMDSITPAGFAGGDRLAIESLLDDRDFPAAADRATSVVDPATAGTATLTWLGRLCFRAGFRARAADFFAQATRIDPANPDVWIRLARCRMSEGEKKAAAAAIAAGLDSVAEDDRRLLAARGAAALGRTAEAERELRDGVLLAGGDVSFAACLVEHLIAWGRGGDAQAFLQEVVDGRWGDRAELKSWAKFRLARLRDGAWR